PQLKARSPDAAFHRQSTAKLADSRTGAGTNAAFLDGSGFRIRARFITGICIRTDLRVTHIQVVEDGCRNDRNFTRGSRETRVVFFYVSHHAARCVQAKRAAAGQDYAMHLVDEIDWLEQICLTRAWRRAAHIHACDRTPFIKDNGAASRPSRIRKVA